MLTFTDDFSQYTTAYLIKSMSEFCWETYWSSDFDNGWEYTLNNFAKYCAEKGISLEFTVSYYPQQDGVAERINHTIMEGERSMLYQAKLPLEFWAEACSTAVYLHNRSPITELKDETHLSVCSVEDQTFLSYVT